MKKFLFLFVVIFLLAGCQSFPPKWNEIYETRRQGGTCYQISCRMFDIWESCGEVKVKRCETPATGFDHALVWFRPFGEEHGKWYDTTMNIGDTATVLCTPIDTMFYSNEK